MNYIKRNASLDKNMVIKDLLDHFGAEHKEEITNSYEERKLWEYPSVNFKVDEEEYTLLESDEIANKAAIKSVLEFIDEMKEEKNLGFSDNIDIESYVDEDALREFLKEDYIGGIIDNMDGMKWMERINIYPAFFDEENALITELKNERRLYFLKDVMNHSDLEEEVSKDLIVPLTFDLNDAGTGDGTKDFTKEEVQETVEELNNAYSKTEDGDVVYALAEAGFKDDMRDPVGYIKDNYGNDCLYEMIKHHIDLNKLAEDVVDMDGWQSSLGTYDGNSEETKNGYVFFRA